MGVKGFDFDSISPQVVEFYFDLGLVAVPAMMVNENDRRIFSFGAEGLGWKTEIDRVESLRRLKHLGRQATGMLIKIGPEFDLLVLDIDRKKGKDGFSYLQQKGLSLPVGTPTVQTPHNGKQFWLKYPSEFDAPIKSTWLFEELSGVEILANSIVPAPPSFVLNHGGRYRWKNSIGNSQLKECPEWILEAIKNRQEAEKAPAMPQGRPPSITKEMRHLSPRQRDKINQWFNIALQSKHPNSDEFKFVLCCVRFGLDDYEILAMLQQCPKARKRGEIYARTTIENARREVVRS